MKAAKEKMILLVFIALALFTCAPSFASTTALEISKTRAEFKTNLGQNRVSESLFYSVKRDRNYDSLGEVALESSVAPSGGANGSRRVTQFFDPGKGDFPIDGRFALSSQPTVGNRIFDGISETTTFVVPQPANNLSQFQRLFTGVGNRRNFVEFDAFPNELVSPGGTKRIFSSVQQTIPGRVDLTGRNATFGTLGTNYLDYGARYVFVPGAFAGGGYYVYDGVFGDE